MLRARLTTYDGSQDGLAGWLSERLGSNGVEESVVEKQRRRCCRSIAIHDGLLTRVSP